MKARQGPRCLPAYFPGWSGLRAWRTIRGCEALDEQLKHLTAGRPDTLQRSAPDLHELPQVNVHAGSLTDYRCRTAMQSNVRSAVALLRSPPPATVS